MTILCSINSANMKLEDFYKEYQDESSCRAKIRHLREKEGILVTSNYIYTVSSARNVVVSIIIGNQVLKCGSARNVIIVLLYEQER